MTGTANALNVRTCEPMVRDNLGLARGVSDEIVPDGYLALTARSAATYGGTSQTPFFLRANARRDLQ